MIIEVKTVTLPLRQLCNIEGVSVKCQLEDIWHKAQDRARRETSMDGVIRSLTHSV